MKLSLLKKFARNDSGATIVEFAIVSSIFFTLMLGVIEYGMFTMTQVALESAVTQAGRATSIGKLTVGATSYPDRATAVTAMIHQKTASLMNASSVIISAAPIGAGQSAATAAPDLCLIPGGEPTSGPTCPAGVPYIDVNGNGVYNGNGSTTVGAAGDLIEVRVSYPWRVLFPILGQFFGEHGIVMITTSTVIKNEPFGNVQ